MITILNNIMASNGFKLVDVDLANESFNSSLYKAESKLREEYFLTIDLNDNSNEALKRFIDQAAQEIFEDIQSSGKVELYFEKNCTMLICLDSSGLDQDLVLALEEDPYNFKKNVIKYSATELAALNAYLTSHSITAITNDTINDILNANSGKDFLEFKHQNRSHNRLYDLIIRVMLKLSFLSYHPQEQKLENLTGQIDAAVPAALTETFERILSADWKDEAVIANVESIWGNKA
ncbi:ABC-three component system middle component 1 [Pseudomonas batumici]|uniref:ABC-three component system middle component 1 n=1 Tax=Pseudomonas batumici TaxID=226910 RepID=UPI000589C929|nr:ABC-three component system middle component 1 [Pseudomonas batumici]